MDEHIKDNINLQSTAQEEKVHAVLIAGMGEGTYRVLDRIIKGCEHEKLVRCFLLSFFLWGHTLFPALLHFMAM